MDTDRIYRETLTNLSLAIGNHPLPGRPAELGATPLQAFCQHYGFNRPNLCQLLKGTSSHDLSVGLFLRLVAVLGLCSSVPNIPAANTMSLRHYLKINHDSVQRGILQLEYA